MIKSLNLKIIRNKVYRLNPSEIFILSFFICLFFYIFEWLLGIDRFYHPDSSHYLKSNEFNLNILIANPFSIVNRGYYAITNLLFNNYYLLILLNFILYSLTNILIFQKIYKKYFNELNNTKLFFLFYLLFLDPYRLHLASHVLKETIIIFIIICIILINSKIIKIFSIFLLVVFRKNSWIYLLIFLTFTRIFIVLKNKIFYIFITLFLIIFISFILLNQNSLDFLQNTTESIIKRIKLYDAQQMPMRFYDHVPQFKDYGFPLGFILKNITWPIMLISGFFIFFVSSLLFKLLALIVLINNLLVFIITKKTFISLGLLLILVMISIYTSSYTSMFRYSYIALYTSTVYFFYHFNIKKN